MYLFFTISGYLFVVGLSLIFTYLFEIFPITKFTKFLSPLEKSTFNKISIAIIPNILWAFIEVAILGDNMFFVLGFFLNVFITMCVMYVIKFGYDLIAGNENNVVNIVAIFFASFFGFFCNYICLLIGVKKEINPIYSLLGLLLLTGIYLIIKFFTPKIEFFKGSSRIE